MRRAMIWMLAALAVGGCAAGLVEEKPPAVYYDLDYPPTAIDCPSTFDLGVEVLNLTVFSPFDRTEMVVEEGNGRIGISEGHQWVANPGRMVAESLVRDLSAGRLFSRAGAGSGSGSFPLELTGRIDEFGWNRKEGSSRAVLATELSLLDIRTRDVLLQRSYRLESRPSGSDDAGGFARAMSGLVRELSTRLQRDLCEEAQTRQENRSR